MLNSFVNAEQSLEPINFRSPKSRLNMQRMGVDYSMFSIINRLRRELLLYGEQRVTREVTRGRLGKANNLHPIRVTLN